jgi:LuxR family maltose regulon positive regulatory protein
MTTETIEDHGVPLAKLSPPRPRKGMVLRPRIAQALARALDSCKLVTLVAPAGSGKTVALAQMLESLPPEIAVGWITLVEDDNLPRLLRSLTLVLERYDLPWRMSPQAMPATAVADSAGLQRVVEALVLAMRQSELPGGVIVLDDVHRLADPQAYRLLERLLESLPPRWLLVMSSRLELPLPRARLRLLDALMELRKEDLYFSQKELQALLSLRAPGQEGQAGELMERTAGWPAGIALHLLDAGRHAPAPLARDIELRRRMALFITEEVVQPLPPGLLAFLERSAVLDELTAARCAYVTGDPRAAHWLDEIDRRDLFVTVLETEEFTLRLHELLRDLLRARLQERHAAELPSLLKRAADTEPSLHRRVDYLLQGGLADAAATVLRDGVIALRREVGDEQIMRLIERFPMEAQHRSPDLALVQGLIALGQFKWREAEPPLRRAMEGFPAVGGSDQALQAWALCCLALLNHRFVEAERLWQAAPAAPTTRLARTVDLLMRLQISLRRGPVDDTPRCLLQLAEATRSLEPEDWVLRTLVRHVRSCVGRPGTDAAVNAMVDVLEAHLQRSGSADLSLQVHSLRGWIALWHGDVVQARQHADRRDEELRWLGRLLPDGQPDRGMANEHIVVLCDYLLGRYEQVAALIRQITVGRPIRGAGQWLFYLAQFAAAEQDWTTLLDTLLAMDNAPAVEHAPPHVMMTLCLRAELALAEGKLDESARLLDEARQQTVPGDMRRANGRLHVDLARLHLRQGDPAAAAAALAPLLSHVNETGEVLGLMLCGPVALAELAAQPLPGLHAPLQRVLRRCLANLRALRQGRAEAAGTATRHAARGMGRAEGSSAGPDTPPAAERGGPLSDRELQVIALLAQGRSNKVIARVLDLSPHTVKRHVARILDKTGQNSRGQAAAWLRARPDLLARVPQLLPPPHFPGRS